MTQQMLNSNPSAIPFTNTPRNISTFKQNLIIKAIVLNNGTTVLSGVM